MLDKNQPHLKRAMLAVSAEPPPDDEFGLPSLKDGEYQAHARPSNKPVYAIHFVTAGGDVRSFQYVHLDSDSRYEAGKITLKFMGMEPVRVILEGRNLWQLFDYLHQHRMPWCLVASRDFAEDGQPIVTRITFTAISDDS